MLLTCVPENMNPPPRVWVTCVFEPQIPIGLGGDWNSFMFRFVVKYA
jgi:hypothetical protein